MEKNKILITGSDGMLGSGLKEIFGKNKNIKYFSKDDFDFSIKKDIKQFFSSFGDYDVLIHCACFTDVNGSELKEKKGILNATNVDALKIISEECNNNNITIIYPQTFLILDSKVSIHSDKSKKYDPLGAYSRSKLRAEQILDSNIENDLLKIIRFGGFYGGGSNIDKNFVGLFLNKILPNSKNQFLKSIEVGNRVWQPTWTRDAAKAIKMILKEKDNYFQFCCHDKTSFSNLSRKILEIIGEKELKIKEVDSSKIIELAKRPDQIIMKSSKLFYDKGLVSNFSVSLNDYLSVYYSYD